ncbi:hypothetical protein [Flavobacterium sp. N2038]|uniref:hypothetical protein n=1 Tax=Flavobacterium sp. N2038 TaxID=2986829 RepID=UPI0022243EFD|nr:hypothetical protein [Flavobacterium sp. N2038]
MINQKHTWIHGFKQKTSIDLDQDRANEIIRENFEPKANKIDIACRLSESINDKDNKLVFTKRQLIDLVLKDNAESEQEIKRLLNQYRGQLNGYVSHIRQELE